MRPVMRLVVVAILVVATGCTAAHRKALNVAGIGASSLALLCDWHQTRAAAGRGWHIGELPQYEHNPVLGSAPSRGEVDLYFAGAMAINAGLWLVLPERWKSVVPGVIIGVEATSIVGNMGTADDPQVVEAIARRDGVTMTEASARAQQMRGLCRL